MGHYKKQNIGGKQFIRNLKLDLKKLDFST